MSKPWILVCPSSRGIGLHLTRHLLRTTTAPVLATTRSADTTAAKARILDFLRPRSGAAAAETETETQTETELEMEMKKEMEMEKEMEDIAPRLKVVRVDVTDESTVLAAAEEAATLFPSSTHHLRLALAVPGILHPEKAPALIRMDDALETFRVNTLGQMALMKHFGDFLPRKGTALAEEHEDDGRGLPPGRAVWAAMSARVGSTSDNRAGGWYSYRASKAGVNSLAKSMDLWLAARSGEKAMAVAYHPGTVRTGLSRPFWQTVPEKKLFAPEYAVERMVSVLTREVGIEGRGRCWDWEGKEILP